MFHQRSVIRSTMRKYNINANIVRIVRTIANAVQMNNSKENGSEQQRSKARMPSLVHSLQHLSRTDHD